MIRDNEIFISVIVFRSWTLSLRDPPCTTHFEKLHIWGGKNKCHIILQHLKCCRYLINTFPPLSENTKDVACRAFVVFLRIQIQSTFQKYGLSWRSVVVFYYKTTEKITITMLWSRYCWCTKKLSINSYERSVVRTWLTLWWTIAFNLPFITTSRKSHKGS